MTQEELVTKVEKLEKELEITKTLLTRFAIMTGMPIADWVKLVENTRKEYNE